MQTELKKSIGFRIGQAANLLNSSFNSELQAFGIAIEQRTTLEIIKYEDNVNQTKIAQILAKDKTTISRTLKALETKGYISKSNIDKRTNLIKLTPKGEEVLEATSKLVKDFRAKLAACMSEEEIDQFFNSLDKLTNTINE